MGGWIKYSRVDETFLQPVQSVSDHQIVWIRKYGHSNMVESLNCSQKPIFRINGKNVKKNVPQDLGKFWDKIVKQCYKILG